MAEKETPEEKAARETVEKIASNIAKLAKSVAALIDGPLKRKALVVLLVNSSGQSKGSVEAVIGALETIEKDWLNQ